MGVSAGSELAAGGQAVDLALPERRWLDDRAARRVILGALVLLFALQVLTRGIPLDRAQVLAWCTATAAALSYGSRRGIAAALRDWVPIAALLTAYDFIRGAVDTLGMPVHIQTAPAADQWLTGTVPTVWLQSRAYGAAGTQWWEFLLTVLYTSHFVVPLAVLAWWWATDRAMWARYLRRFLAVTAVALASFALLPTAPPWLAAKLDAVEPVRRTAFRGWEVVDLHIAAQWLETGAHTVNRVAAFPSLHTAYPALIAVLAWPRVRSHLARVGLAAYAVGMAFTLVLTGEHWLVDVLAAWLLVAAVCVVAGRLDGRRAAQTGRRITGRRSLRRATSVNPAERNTDATPRNADAAASPAPPAGSTG